MFLPSREQCIAFFHKYELPVHMIRHLEAVEKLAVFLSEKFNKAGIPVDVELVSKAALLHDIDKPQTLKKGFEHLHSKMSREIIEKEGFPKLAIIAEKHLLETILKENPFDCWEEKIVYYSDKRIKHDQLVSLQERFEYLLETYGDKKVIFDRISTCKPKVEELEKEIFSKIDITPSLEGF